MRELGNNLDLIKEFGCDDVVLRQVLRQLIYFIVSISLNQLLGKFPTCSISSGLQDLPMVKTSIQVGSNLPLICWFPEISWVIYFFSTKGSLQLDKSNATALQCFSNWRVFIKEEYERRSNNKRVESISAVISTYASEKARREWCQAPSSNVWLIDRRSGTSSIIESPDNTGYI